MDKKFDRIETRITVDIDTVYIGSNSLVIGLHFFPAFRKRKQSNNPSINAIYQGFSRICKNSNKSAFISTVCKDIHI